MSVTDSTASTPRALARGAGRRRRRLKWNERHIDGRRVRYGTAGQGPPFVFLHGWGLRDRTYERALVELAGRGVRVIAPSLPGFGGSDALPRGSFSLEGYADFVAEFTAELGIEEPIRLGGHSFGGGVATLMAHRHPDKVKLLVLVNSIGGAIWQPDGDGTTGRSLASRPLWDWGIHFPRDMASNWDVLPVVMHDASRNLLRDPVAFWRVAKLARNADLRSELRELAERQLPVVILWGDEDRILPPPSVAAMAEAIGDEPHVVEGSHSWMLTDPKRFGEIMTNVVGLPDAIEALGDRR